MYKTIFFPLATLVMLFALSPLVSAKSDSDEPTVYVIQKGDTLWGLSDRFMKDPYYWPNLWAKNPTDIGNPHFIYPGQKLKIYGDRLEVVPATAEGENISSEVKGVPASLDKPVVTAVQTKQIDDAVANERTIAVNGGEGFILEKGDKPMGIIVSVQQNRRIAGEDDLVYVDLGRSNGVKVGDRFSVYKKSSPISHPISNLIVGERVIPLGTVQVTEVEDTVSKALITRSFMEIEPGAYLGYIRNSRRDIALVAADRDLKGYIIETKTGSNNISAGDVAYLDLGKQNGVKAGQLFYVVRDVKVDSQYVTGPVEKLPVDVVGALVVVDVGVTTTTAVVVKSIDTIYRGDRVELRKNR